MDIANGTVYPILRKLKADGLLTTYLQEEIGGPPRKYYRLTELGRETYSNDRAEYLKFANSVRMLLEGNNNDAA
ncbi:MAG: PadR family transcriptional regulator [Christensenellales bacterium]